MEIDTSTEISTPPPLEKANDDTILNTEEPPNVGRRLKSLVWNYFTLEHAGPGRLDARCKRCKKSFAYINGPALAGTSHLKRHIAHFEGLFTMETDALTEINAPPLEKHNGDTMLSSEERPTKRRRKKSRVWKYFTLKPAGPDRLVARCKRCNISFPYANGTKVAGTSHLKRHIASFHQEKRHISSEICSLSKLTLDS